jgi:alkanesulfonate monooxygenase SsuD/methylene tetrahydromethanopterin reductase-like flavin-dependent oxidoreductase (luciferase family)
MATEQHRASPREHTDRTGIRSAVSLPLFDALADPAVVARLAAEAEEAGWHGVFVWDHVRWNAPIQQVADPWITMAAIATATERVRIGPMVTPLPRRRPVKVARETATLDRLSGGRLILGVGIGLDRFAGEFSKTGEQVDDRLRGEMLDEALEILAAAWSGEPVHHHGTHYTVDDIQFLPRPVQRPGIPVWAAAFTGNRKPLRRAARCDGLFPANVDHPDTWARERAVRHRRWPADRRRPGALRQGWRHLVAAGVPTGSRSGRGARRAARWTSATLSLST